MSARAGMLPRQLTLAYRQVRAGRVAQACEMRVGHGRVWVTQEGRGEDFWLRRGACMVLLPGALVVIEADHAASLSIEPLAQPGVGASLRWCLAFLRRALWAGMRGKTAALPHAGKGR